MATVHHVRRLSDRKKLAELTFEDRGLQLSGLESVYVTEVTIDGQHHRLETSVREAQKSESQLRHPCGVRFYREIRDMAALASMDVDVKHFLRLLNAGTAR